MLAKGLHPMDLLLANSGQAIAVPAESGRQGDRRGSRGTMPVGRPTQQGARSNRQDEAVN